MIGHGGGDAIKMLKNNLLSKLIGDLFLYKPVRKYQFTMSCIRAIDMSAYQVITCLISQPKHMLLVLKRTIAMRRFF